MVRRQRSDSNRRADREARMLRAIAALAGLLLLAGCSDGDDAAPSVDGGAGGWQGGSPGGGADGSSGWSSDAAAASTDAGGLPPGFQAGTLTAGSFDDHYYPKTFDEFIGKMESRTGAPAKVSQRVIVKVTDSSGHPVTDAAVTVRAAGQSLVTLTTGSDGEALFLPLIDGAAAKTPLELHVSRGSAQATAKVSGAGPWKVTLPGIRGALPKKLDVAFVLDTTGSMSDELRFLEVETSSIVSQVTKLSGQIDIRFALVVYRDNGDAYTSKAFDFDGVSAFSKSLAAQSASGGGDYPEAMDAGLARARGLSWRSGDVARLLFLIGDAPPHASALARALGLMDAFRRKGVRVYPIAASGANSVAEYVMRVGAYKTLARYIFLTNDSGYGGSHADPKVPPHTPTKTDEKRCYNVERLAYLMARMITSELSGKPLPPAKTEVIKRVGTVVDGICDPAEKNASQP